MVFVTVITGLCSNLLIFLKMIRFPSFFRILKRKLFKAPKVAGISSSVTDFPDIVLLFSCNFPRRFTPESSRYLLLKGKVTQTEELLRGIAATNKKEYPEESLLDLHAEGKVEALGDVRDLFRTKKMLHRTLVSWYAW